MQHIFKRSSEADADILSVFYVGWQIDSFDDWIFRV